MTDDTFSRAFVVGRGPGGATLAVSSGLLTALPAPEVAAVVAHELAHVRTRDVLPQTYAVLLSTTFSSRSAESGGFLARFLLAVLAPIGAAFTHLLLFLEAGAASRRRRRGHRRSARPCGRADPPRSRRRTRRVPRLAGDHRVLRGDGGDAQSRLGAAHGSARRSRQADRSADSGALRSRGRRGRTRQPFRPRARARSRARRRARAFDAVPPGERHAEDPEAVARLRALGYVAASAPRKARYTDADDPKRLVGLDRAVHDAVEAFGARRFDEAVRI